MNITEEIIITDTNIITDLSISNLLEDFIKIDNAYIVEIIKKYELNKKTGNIKSLKQLLIN